MTSITSVKRLLQRFNIKLDAFQHHICHPLGLHLVRIPHHLHQASRHNLPRDTKPIREPTTLRLLTAVREQCGPQAVNLVLVLANGEKGRCRRECVISAAIQEGYLLSVEDECDQGIVAAYYARIFKEGDIELGGLNGVFFKPEACVDFVRGNGEC